MKRHNGIEKEGCAMELMPFPLKLQRNNQQNASTMKSAKGKTGEKGPIFTVLWR
ncbi:hypothetical protein [uncultured Bilophila sp.]|uniref:hypothetical protein n=1 Tax=uncultured Bilophila sp. TaxID=529385 RepID=UPI00280AEE09|nr:hypothetical protein [uncultured Bilophila sp.]